ncbi:MAG: DMT family transporter, partial [Panacagrimonas sp.]
LAWRYILATVALAPVVYALGRRGDRRGLRVAALAGLIQSLIAVISLSALKYVPAGPLAFLFYTYPGWVAVVARIRHSEPLTPLRLAALVLSLVGIFVMVGAPGGITLHPIGVLLAMISAVLYAIYIPMIGKMQRELSPVVTATYMTAGAAFFLGVAAATRGEFRADLHMTAWWSILALALVSTALAFLIFLRGLDVLGPVRAAIVSTVEPFFTAILGATVLAQPLTRTTFIGGVFIAAAVVMLQLRRANGTQTTAA